MSKSEQARELLLSVDKDILRDGDTLIDGLKRLVGYCKNLEYIDRSRQECYDMLDKLGFIGDCDSVYHGLEKLIAEYKRLEEIEDNAPDQLSTKRPMQVEVNIDASTMKVLAAEFAAMHDEDKATIQELRAHLVRLECELMAYRKEVD